MHAYFVLLKFYVYIDLTFPYNMIYLSLTLAYTEVKWFREPAEPSHKHVTWQQLTEHHAHTSDPSLEITCRTFFFVPRSTWTVSPHPLDRVWFMVLALTPPHERSNYISHPHNSVFCLHVKKMIAVLMLLILKPGKERITSCFLTKCIDYSFFPYLLFYFNLP